MELQSQVTSVTILCNLPDTRSVVFVFADARLKDHTITGSFDFPDALQSVAASVFGPVDIEQRGVNNFESGFDYGKAVPFSSALQNLATSFVRQGSELSRHDFGEMYFCDILHDGSRTEQHTTLEGSELMEMKGSLVWRDCDYFD